MDRDARSSGSGQRRERPAYGCALQPRSPRRHHALARLSTGSSRRTPIKRQSSGGGEARSGCSSRPVGPQALAYGLERGASESVEIPVSKPGCTGRLLTVPMGSPAGPKVRPTSTRRGGISCVLALPRSRPPLACSRAGACTGKKSRPVIPASRHPARLSDVADATRRLSQAAMVSCLAASSRLRDQDP